jgi:hypothetical protein
MPSRFDNPQDPKLPDPDSQVDLTKRYDVYCTRRGQAIVYRNVLFKGIKSLFSGGTYDVLSQFFEMEHINGDRVFISRTEINAFCEHGRNLGMEYIREG